MRSKSLRILLINDTRGIAARQTVLERHGHKVSVAPSVQEGLDQLSSQTFDLVVTVYRMPNSSGQQVIDKIRQHDPKILVVVLAGDVEILGLTEKSTGADIVLSKGPHEVQDLLRAIDHISSRRIPTKPPGSVRTGSRAPKGKTG